MITFSSGKAYELRLIIQINFYLCILFINLSLIRLLFNCLLDLSNLIHFLTIFFLFFHLFLLISIKYNKIYNLQFEKSYVILMNDHESFFLHMILIFILNLAIKLLILLRIFLINLRFVRYHQQSLN
jgi:hypothetical protein